MLIKETPEDFIVREVYNLDGVSAELTDRTAGEFAYFLVEKRNVSTIDAAIFLAGELGAPTEEVRFAGLKDKQAKTVQVMSAPGSYIKKNKLSFSDGRIAARFIGFCKDPATSERLIGNQFDITIRNLTKDAADRFLTGLGEAAEFGIPNYFDDQRFGAARSGKGFPALELVLGDAEEALKLLVATPSTLDSPVFRARKQQMERAWGDWRQCLELSRSRQDREVFESLIKSHGDFREAFRFVPRRERLMQLFAYQSYLWNRALSKLIVERCGSNLMDSNLIQMASELGNQPAWRTLTNEEQSLWLSTDLPLPDHKTKCKDSAAQAALDAVFAEDGIRGDMLRIDGIRGLEFREEERACILFPDALEADDPIRDDRHDGAWMIEMKLTLPKGAYATLMIKRAAAI
ncbi:MAG: tRNA pseudouridine(13) synthase TruD [Planctomycetota bacterium]